jgi:glycogen operon protein
MTVDDWRSGARSLAVLLNGNAITEPGSRGETITDMSFLLLFNAGDQDVSFTLPGPEAAGGWQVITDTAEPGGQEPGAGAGQGAAGTELSAGAQLAPASTREVISRSVVILRATGS